MSANASPAGHLLVDRELVASLGRVVRARPGAPPPAIAQVQPASVDLRLGDALWRVPAGFLPAGIAVEERLRELGAVRASLENDGAVLERGHVYLALLEEELALPADLRARFNPRSSTGRCDVFTRVLCDGHARFDEAPPGYAGKLWIEIAPLSFSVRLRRGDRLAQLRLARGNAALDRRALAELHASTPLALDGGRALRAEERIDEDGCLTLSVGLASRSPAGWRARETSAVLELAREGAHDPAEWWEPVAGRGARCILEPEHFYVFASKERLRIPPDHAAEMLPVDIGIGELRNNYAGFFDNGFGWRESDDAREQASAGTPAVLEVRAHDVPFLVEDGQLFCRLRFFRTNGRPDRVYGEGRATSYKDQDLTLARCFRAR